MKRSQTITLLALGITLSACSGNSPSDNTNYCDRSDSNYDQQKCDAQLDAKQHSYHHGGYVYYPWFRNNYHNSYIPRLSYGWNHGGTAFVPVPVTSYAPAIGAARASAVSTGTSSGVSSAARGGFGSIGAGHAGGGGE